MIGITRRVDELGRVVLPKELRNKLNINSGDLLEFILQDNDILLVRKYAEIDYCDKSIANIIQKLANILNCNIYIVISSKIVFSTKSEYVGITLNKNMESYYKNSKLEHFYLLNNRKLGTNITKKVLLKGSEQGYVIFEFNYDEIREEYIRFIDLCTKLICSNFD